MINPDAFLRFLSALFYDEILSSSASEKDDRQYYQLWTAEQDHEILTINFNVA